MKKIIELKLARDLRASINLWPLGGILLAACAASPDPQGLAPAQEISVVRTQDGRVILLARDLTPPKTQPKKEK